MYQLLLSAHIIAGILAIASSLHVLLPKLQKLERAITPAIVAVSASGVGLLFTGASTARVCTSGVLMVAALVGIKKLSNQKVLQAQQISD